MMKHLISIMLVLLMTLSLLGSAGAQEGLDVSTLYKDRDLNDQWKRSAFRKAERRSRIHRRSPWRTRQ